MKKIVLKNMKKSLFVVLALKKIVFAVIALYAMIGVQAKEYSFTAVDNDPMNARIYTLDNGLTVYMTQNQEKPEIQTFIAVRAGSQNDPLKSTGLAHYQEHLMFKGTKLYGTTSYESELPNLNAIDSLYEVYGATTDAERRKAIYHLIDSFSYENSKIAIANEFDKLMGTIGASRVNAFTSEDMTCYHEIIPAGELTRWAMIESDRFQNQVVRGFHTELEAVYEEFNLYSTEDRDKVMLAIDQVLYSNIPYRQHNVIGTQEDLKNPSLIRIKQFYNTFYRPNNVAICLSGDLDFDHTIAVIDQYFGQWQPGEIPAFEQPVQSDLVAPKDTIVYGKEAAQVWLAWKIPNVRYEDYDALNIISSVLSNGKAGLIDLDINQAQMLLGAAAFLQGGNDFSTFYLVGVPKEKQTLTEVKRLLLAEIDKLKKGEFTEELLKSILRNEKRDELIGLQDNKNRTMQFVESFIYQIPYERVVTRLNRIEKLTKEDIVRVANKYFGDNYVCVNKHQSDDNVNPNKVEKPAITPIEMNREAQSKFFTDLVNMPSDSIQPQFLDFNKDLSRSILSNGVELFYVQNKENDLAQLRFIINKGTDQDPVLQYATDLLYYLGTDELTADQYQTQLYSLASEAVVVSDANTTELSVHGLQETLSEALQLMENWVLTAVPNDFILKELIKDNIKSHNDAKADQETCFSQLNTYGLVGAVAVQQRTLTPKQLRKLKAQKVLNHLRRILPAIERVEYFGPLNEEEVKAMLSTSNLMVLADPTMRETLKRIENEVVIENEVLIAPYDANNVYIMQYANWGEVYTPKDEAIIRLFNEYFDGSMGSIVFQEMREARALCYASGANYTKPSYKGENNIFYTYILSQNDKLKDCLDAFDSICNNLPLSQTAFDNAKSALIKRIEQRRYVRSAPSAYYTIYTDLGWDHDWNEDIYREVKNLTLDDVVAFQKAHVANRTYRTMVLGKEKELDMDCLQGRGTIKRLTLKDIFVY